MKCSRQHTLLSPALAPARRTHARVTTVVANSAKPASAKDRRYRAATPNRMQTQMSSLPDVAAASHDNQP